MVSDARKFEAGSNLAVGGETLGFYIMSTRAEAFAVTVRAPPARTAVPVFQKARRHDAGSLDAWCGGNA